MAVFNLPVLILSDRTAPVISIPLGNSTSIDEDVSTGSLIATVQDDGTAVSYALDPNTTTNPGSDIALDTSTGDITVANALDYETTTTYTLGITATDSLGNTSNPLIFTININDIDELAPIVTKTSQPYFSLFETENNLTIATFTVTDNGVPVTSGVSWSATPNTTNFDFSYNSTASEWQLRSAASGQLGGGVTSDQTFVFTISHTDAAGLTGDETCTLVVKDAVAPTMSGPTTISRSEGTSTGTNIGTYTATGSQPVTWTLSGTDASDFTITTSGQLRFASSPDYENPADSNGDNVYTLTVRATNQFGYDEQNVTVTVTNVADSPLTITTYDHNLTVSEKPASNTNLVSFQALETNGTNVSSNLSVSITPSSTGFSTYNSGGRKYVRANGGQFLGGGVYVNTDFTITASGTSSDGLTSSASRTVDVQDKTLTTGGTKLVEPSSTLARNGVYPEVCHVDGTYFYMFEFNTPSVGSVRVTRLRISDGLYQQWDYTLPSSNSTAHKTVRQGYVLSNVLYVMTDVDTYNSWQRPLVYKRALNLSGGAMTFVNDVAGWSGGSSVSSSTRTSFHTSNSFWMRDDTSSGSNAEWRAFTVTTTNIVEAGDNIRFTSPLTNLHSGAHVWGNYVLFVGESFSGLGTGLSAYSFNQSTTSNSHLGSHVQTDAWENLATQAGYTGNYSFTANQRAAVHGNYLYFYHRTGSQDYTNYGALYRFNISNIAGSE